MWKKFVAMSVCLSAFLGLACGPAAWGKPADLPVPGQMQCPDGEEKVPHGEITLGLDLLTGRVTVKVETAAAPEWAPLTIDAVMPALIEQLFTQAAEALAQRRDGVPAADKQAQRLFEVAERLRRSGNYEKARVTYQQVHLLTPTSRLGRLAIDRLQEVEERMREPFEESGDDDPEALFRDMRENSVPLGLVELSY